MNKVFYLKYLISPEWKEKRQQKLYKDSMCEHCRNILRNSNNATQVHHLTYIRLGNERMEDLMSVCYRCHILLEIKKYNLEEYNKLVKKYFGEEEEKVHKFIMKQMREAGVFDDLNAI